MSLDRINKNVEAVETSLLEDSQLFIYPLKEEMEIKMKNNEKLISDSIISPSPIINLALLKNHFKKEGRLSHSQLITILNFGIDILKRESNLLEISIPITSKYLIFLIFL